MECELRSIRQAAQNQERTIQGLNESISTKDSEVCYYICIKWSHVTKIVVAVISEIPWFSIPDSIPHQEEKSHSARTILLGKIGKTEINKNFLCAII